MSTIYDEDRARDWLLWKSESASWEDLQVFVKIMAHAMLNRDIYLLFQERIQADRKKNLVDG